MPKINLLSKEISELIAAGEVVERPASVVKELIENSIDARSKHITVEISRGGISLIRITDDGCGISHSDVPLAFKRHATSKIKSASDLDAIATLGFRGEALAATCCVSRVEMFTKTPDEDLGTHYVTEGAEEKVYEESGCPNGTTIIIRDIFYNTPARMKFLKKDASEGTAASAVTERAALSHPEIAFKLIREGKCVLATSGDGNLYSTVYAVLGRDFASGLIEINSFDRSVSVAGYTCKPILCRQSRASQYVFLNGRTVRSATVTAAAEQAYKNSAMVGKYPAFVIFLNIPAQTVDVNVHPAKTEIRFSDEKLIFDAVYSAVKSAIMSGDTRPELLNMPSSDIGKLSAERYTQQPVKQEMFKSHSHSFDAPAENFQPETAAGLLKLKNDTSLFFEREDVKRYINGQTKEPLVPEPNDKSEIKERDCTPPADSGVKIDVPDMDMPSDSAEDIIYIGEAFETYIIVQKGGSIYIIDKHAAHERIIFNKLKSEQNTESQVLASPEAVRLGENELDGILANLEALKRAGFDIEDFGNSSVIVRAVPAMLVNQDVAAVVTEAAESLCTVGKIDIEALDSLYHTVACRAAVKAGYITPKEEQLSLAKTVLSSNEIMYCPHGRPVAFEIKRKELEKRFGRIQ